MKYPNRNKHCPVRKTCFDYFERACDTCDFGKEYHSLHRRIARLEKKLKDQEEIKHAKDADKID